MRDTIIKELEKIELTENVKIIQCVESGSRAWGFASPDSDFDVRFIYVRPREFYLRLDKTRDVIEWKLDDVLDINGWDLQKALRLLHTSNPTLFEWNASPIVYKTAEEWKNISACIDEYFLSKTGLYHYLSTAKRNYREYLKEATVKLKKYFYVLRPLLACRWILDRKTPPPMRFKELVTEYADENIRPYIERLLELKSSTPEIGEGNRIDALNKYIEQSIAELNDVLEDYPADRKADWTKLNKIFLELTK